MKTLWTCSLLCLLKKRSTEVNVKNYSNQLRLYFHQIHVPWSQLPFIPIYLCCCKLIEHWIGYNGLGLLKHQETEVDVQNTWIRQGDNLAKYMYHSWNYCKTLGTIYLIFIVIHRLSPESDVVALVLYSTVFNLKY